MRTEPPRYADLPLPPYAYVPGGAPHPFRHPDGHAWVGGHAPDAPAWAPGPWQADVAWRHGVDLANHGFWWEAHEVWEGMWRQVRPTDPLRPVLQGLIQLMASEVKRRQGDPVSAARLRARALTRLSEARVDRIHGLSVRGLRQAVAATETGVPPLRLEVA